MSQRPTQKETRVIGILAGGGSLPREIAQRVTARGDRVHIVAIAGETSANYAPYPSTKVGWGKIGGMIAALKGAGCSELVIVGSVKRPDLFAVRPDFGLVRQLPAIVRIILAGGDDGVLTRVVRFFEQQGFRVSGPGTVAPELLVGEGPVGRVEAQPGAVSDVALGFDLLRRLGPYDVGQAVVVAGGRIEAVEGNEGTDRMLARVAQRRDGASTAAPGVLIKRPKPGQELRIDMPAIGPETVRRAAEAGLAGIAVMAGSTLVAERPAVVRDANAAGLFVQGFNDTPSGPKVRRTPSPTRRLVKLGKRSPTTRHHGDATKAAELLCAIAPALASRGAVIDRGHVLAVESGEGVDALIARAGTLRQWGAKRFRRGSGLAILADVADVATAVRAGANAGLAGVALVGDHSIQSDAALRALIAEGDYLGLFLALLPRDDARRGIDERAG